ncbi:Ni/Fe-hydrogenase cytochrome b subunit [bacterium]|nr:Ni/Fe-hydrogenase cytochrome b subunit [bacterium]NCT22234.1 Ni/Fe-hydrogenase cytochrome b subunit [bacterium]
MKLNLTIQPRFRIGLFPLVLAILAGVAFVIAMLRFIYGIGAISNLNNAYPWAFWVSFDLFTGIAISSGAFILASIVYIFELEEFRPLLRPTLLTGLLGYIMEIIALMVDLGHPERIWHYFVYQNFNSFLLVIGFYVMIYSAVMAAEFAPAVFEKFHWTKAASLIHRWMKPIVIVGAVLSTLHQAALGSLLLIQPTKLFPLWWTPWIPPLFFVSAIAIGLAMTIFESSLSSRYFHRGLETHLLEKLAKAIPVVLVIYALLKFGELAWAGDLGYLFTSGAMSVLFWAEIILGILIPTILFSIKKVRQSANGLLTGAIVLLLGMILNRFNVSWFGVQHPDPLTYMPTFMSNVHYFPTLPEVAVSVGIFSAGILAFGLAAKYLPVFEEENPRAAGD